MNPLFRELVEKAGIKFGNFESVTVDIDEVEALILLVMKECATACNNFDCGRTLSAQDLIGSRFNTIIS